jgi:hypothetical protein
MHLKVYALALFAFLVSLITTAQDSYSPGKVYTLQGDTLTGGIYSQRSARYVRFKAPSGDVAEYGAGRLAGFETEGSIFQRLAIEVKDVDGIRRKDTVFMQLLVSGRVNLYQYKEKDTEEHYWVRKGDQQHELRVVRKFIEKNGQNYLSEVKEYQGILIFLFSDCPRMKSQEYGFSRESLMAAAFTYNHCFEEAKASVVYKKRARLHIHPGLKGGLNALSRVNSTRGYGSLAGVFVNVPFTGANRAVSAQLEVVHNQYNTADEFYTYHYQVLDVGAFVRCTAPKGWVRPFIAAGLVRGSGHLRAKKTVPGNTYRVDGGRMIKFAGETGIQIPLSKHYAYTGLRYDVMLNNRLDKFKIVHLAFAFGF